MAFFAVCTAIQSNSQYIPNPSEAQSFLHLFCFPGVIFFLFVCLQLWVYQQTTFVSFFPLARRSGFHVALFLWWMGGRCGLQPDSICSGTGWRLIVHPSVVATSLFLSLSHSLSLSVSLFLSLSLSLSKTKWKDSRCVPCVQCEVFSGMSVVIFFCCLWKWNQMVP